MLLSRDLHYSLTFSSNPTECMKRVYIVVQIFGNNSQIKTHRIIIYMDPKYIFKNLIQNLKVTWCKVFKS